MRWTPTGLHALVLVVLLVVGPLAGGSVVAAQQANETATQTPTASPSATPTESPTRTPTATATATATPAPTQASDSEYTYEELKADGPHWSNAPDSVRFGEERMFWVVHWPASSTFANPGEDDQWQYLAPDVTVGRNGVWLRSIIQDPDAGSVTVHVVAWQKAQQEVTRGNTTTSEPVAVNVSHTQYNVDLQRGWLMERIRLGQHDQPTRITMWVEGVDGARWTFRHHSVATTQSIAITSWGDYLEHVAVDIVAVAIAGGFVVGLLVKKALDRAGRGPYGSYAPWVIGGSILGGIGATVFYTSLAEIAVTAPWSIGVGVVIVFGIILLETYTNSVGKALFLQPKLEHTTSPTGEDAYDIIKLEAESHTTVRMPSGGVAIIKNGLFAFLARVWGRAAFLETADWFTEANRIETKIETDHSVWDDVYLIDPEANFVVDYQAEGWTLEYPDLTRETAFGYISVTALVGAVGVAAYSGLISPFIGFGAAGIGILAWGLTPTNGHAEIVPAPTHFRPAFGTIASMIQGYSDAETIEEATDQLQQERVRKAKDVEEQIEKRDSSLVREMEGGDISAGIRSDDGNTDVKEREQRRRNGDRDERGEQPEDIEAATDGGEDDGE